MLLSNMRITSTNGCGCDEMAATMDTNGCEWCSDHIGEIVSHMKNEARKRGIPFVEMVASRFVRLAIRIAQRRGLCDGSLAR